MLVRVLVPLVAWLVLLVQSRPQSAPHPGGYHSTLLQYLRTGYLQSTKQFEREEETEQQNQRSPNQSQRSPNQPQTPPNQSQRFINLPGRSPSQPQRFTNPSRRFTTQPPQQPVEPLSKVLTPPQIQRPAPRPSRPRPSLQQIIRNGQTTLQPLQQPVFNVQPPQQTSGNPFFTDSQQRRLSQSSGFNGDQAPGRVFPSPPGQATAPAARVIPGPSQQFRSRTSGRNAQRVGQGPILFPGRVSGR